MQSSKTPGTGGTQKRPSSARTAETSTPRGLANTSNGAGAGSLKKTNGKSRGEADSYYGTSPAHPMVSSNSAINGGAHDASIYCSTDPGNGVSGMYNPEFQPTYSNQGASYGANTIDTGASVAIPIPNPEPSASQYNPVPVPQMNPFYPSASAAFAGTNAIVSTNNSHTDHVNLHATGEAASYYGNPQAGTSVASSFGSTPATNQQNNSGLSHSIGSSISAVAGALHAHHNHNHSHNHNHPPPPLRQSFKKLWESLRAEERYAVGEFELYSEITGICAKCFTPGTSYTQAPRTHHYGQRWSKSKGWRVKKSKSSRRVWMIIFRRNDASGFISASSSSSSSSDSTSSVSDSDLSDTTRKRRRLEKQIIREKKELKRQEKREQKEQDCSTRRHSNGSSILTSTGSAANTIWKNISGGSAGESDHRYTKTSMAYSAPGVLRGGDLNKSKDTVFYNPGYGPDGKAHPTYYPQSTPHATNGKTSQSVLSSWFGSSSNTRKSKHSRNGSRASVDSNNAQIGQLFDVSSSASDDGLAYGRYSSSPSSLGSKKKGWFFRMKRDTKGQSKVKKGKKGKSSASSDSGSKSSSSVSFSGDELAYGSGKSASLGSASIKSKQSYTGSVAESVKSASSKVSSVFGIGKRRKGWDDYGTPSHGRNGSGSAMVGPGMKRSNSTGGSRGWGSRTTSAPAATVAPVTATGTSSWWSNRVRKSDSSTTTGKQSLAQRGWLPGGDRQSGGWFGGSGTTRTSRSESLSSRSDNSWQEGLENEEHQEPYVYNLGGRETKSSSAISSTLIGTKSHSSTDVTSSIKDKGIYVQRQSSDSQVFTTLPSGERKSTREAWIQDNRRERSPDRSNFITGRPKRESSVDSWESYDSRQQDSRQSRGKTSKTGIWSLFSGRSQSIRDSDRGHSKESKLKSKRTDESVEGSGKNKSAVYVERDGKVTRKELKSSLTTSDIATPKAEQHKLAMVYPVATDDPTRFETTSSETNINRRQSEGYSFVQESYKSEQRYSGQERHSSRTAASATAIATASTTAGEGTKVVVGGFSPLPGSVEQPRRPLAAPIQPVQPVQPTSTTTIINNTIHHITSNTNNNSSTSISNVAQNVVVVPSPVPVPVHSVSSSSVERTHSQSSTAGYSAAMVQDVAAAAAGAAAVQVASAYERERAEREERERREIISRERRNESGKERSERIQRELMELRLREEEAALLHKEKSEREEKERRALRVAIELKEQEESDLKLKRGREEREAIERKKKEEWVARETEKDEAARLARQKQDKERFEQIKADEERKYREWCRQESLRRQQRERDEEERFQQNRKEEEENNRRLEAQAIIQKEAERIKAIEVAKRLKIEEELQRSKDEEKKAEQRRVEVSVKLEEEARKIQKLEEEKRAYETASQSFSAGLASQQQKGFADGIEFQKKRDAYIQAASQGQQSSTEVQRMEFQREQDRLAQQAQAVEDLRRVQFEAQIHSTKREQQNIETQRIEISEERSRTTEKLSKLTQVAFEAQRLGDKSKVREVEQQIEVEKEKASRLRIEEEKKAVAVAELKRQEDMRVRELEMQVADERKRDVAALVEGQKIVAAEAEAKKRQHDEKVQQLNSQIRIEKDKETKLKIEEEKRVLDQMEQTRLRDEKTREYIAQVHVEEEKSMQVQVEQQKSAQVEAKSRHRQDESRSIAKQMVTEKERVRLRQMDQERGQIETRREEKTRIEEERGIATAVEQLEQGALEHEAANQAALEFRFKEEEGMSEEQRMIQAEVRRRWENEHKEQQRIELEKQLADIQRKIAEKEQRETKRARSRARKADPAYKEREDRRSRERSKAREDEAEKARRAEIEFIRKNAGLDKVEKKKEVKKKRYSTFDPLPTGDIPGFIERSWSVPNGIPRLIETPATPPPGILRFPQRIHCEGSYFPRVPIEVDPNIPVVPAFPQIYVAEPETFAETSAEFEGRSQKDLSMSTSRTETTQSVTSSQFEAVAESSRKIERSITSSEFEGRTEKDSVRVEPVRAVTTSEVERSSETTGAASSVTEGHSIAPAETTKPASRWGSFGFGSGLARAVTQAISDAPSLVTGKPFSGTPVAPTPTVPNLGAAVIDYQQRSDSQQDGQTVSQQQQQQELYQYGPPLPPNFSFKEPTRTADGPELPQSFGHQTSSAVYQDSTRSDSQSQSTYEWVSLDHSRQQATKPNFSEVVYGPALPPVSAPQQTAYNQGATVSSDRHSESYSREQISSQVVSTPALPQVQTPHQYTYDDSTQSFRIPGTFDDEEVPPEVISPISRNNQTSSVPVYYPPTEINNRSVSERNARSESISRVESLSKEISVDQISLENQASSVPTYRPTVEDRTVSELFYSTENSSKSGLSISKETGVDVREISHDNQMSSVSINRPALAGENRSMSEPAKGIYSTESVSGLASLSKEVYLRENSRGDQSSSTPVYPTISGDKRAFSEPASALYLAESETRQTSSLSRDQDFQTPPSGSTHESTPIQGVPSYRQQPSPPNVFAFLDEEASAVTSASRERAVVDKRLTQEQIDKNDDLMAVAMASAEEAGFSTDLAYGGLNRHRLSTVLESGETTPTGRRPSIVSVGRRPSIARPRSAFIEEVEDEDSPKAKRQLGQYELSPEAYLSQAETLARDEARSQSEQRLVEQQSRPSTSYSSTPKAEERRPVNVPLPQPTPPSVTSVAKESLPTHSASPSEAVVQERRNRAHGVSRTPALRSASVSGGFKMDPVREDDPHRPPPAPRSSSLSGFFRSKGDSSRRGSSAVGPAESLHGSAPSFADSGVGLERNDSTMRGRVPRTEEEEAELRKARRQREREEFERRDRGREGPTEPSALTSHEQPSPVERHSRRSIDSVRRFNEGYTPAEGTEINEEDGKTEPGSPHKARSKMQKVVTLGKMFGWGNRARGESKSRGEKSGSKSREASQTRSESVKPHKRSVSDASGMGERPAGLTRHNTEEWEQVAVTPPQKSRASSLREVDMGASYERVENDTMGSAPMGLHEEPENYSEGAGGSRSNFDSSAPQYVEASTSKSTPPEATAHPETPERPKSERRSSTKAISGMFRAARSLRRGSQTPPRITTEELGRTDTDRKGSRPSSSAGVSLHQDDAREEQGRIENTWGYSSRGDLEEQRAEDIPLPSSGVEEKEPGHSRLPLSREMLKKSTKSLGKESEAGGSQSGSGSWSQATAEGREEEGERGSDSNSTKKSRSFDRKVKQTANSHAQSDGEPVAKSYNCVEKSTSAMMLTLSEGVDLSSDVKEQEDTRSLFEPPDIFDDRDFPPSNENLPLESPNSLYSPIQHIPDIVSFVSHTPSPVLEPATVDIYEEYPASSQSDSSPNSPHISQGPKPQNTASEPVLGHDKVIASSHLSGLSSYVQTPVGADVQPQWQPETQSPFVFFQASLPHNFPINPLSMPEFPKAVPEDRSVSPKNVPISPVNEVQSLPLSPNNPSTQETFESFQFLPKTRQSTPEVQQQETPISSIPDPYPAPTEYYPPSITENRATSPIIEVQPATSTPLSEPRPVHDGIGEDKAPAVDRYIPPPVNENQKLTVDTPIEEVGYHSQPNTFTEDLETLPLSPIERQEYFAEQQFDKETGHFGGEPQSPDSASDALEGLSNLFELPLQDFRGPNQEFTPTSNMQNHPPVIAPSEPSDQSYVQVQSASSLSGRSSPHLSEPVSERSQYVPQDEQSPLYTSPNEKEVAQPAPPQLDTDFSYHDTGNLPGVPLSDSSPIFFSPESPPAVSSAALVAVPDESSISRAPSAPESPVVVLDHDTSTLPLSEQASPRNQPEIPQTEPAIENFSLISRPSSPQLPEAAQSSPEQIDDMPTTLVDLSGLPQTDLVSTYPTFEESIRQVDSRSPSIVAEDEPLTGACLDEPTSPMSVAVPDDLPQLAESSSLYDAPEDLYEFTALSPIEEMSESAISRPPSTTAGEGSSVAMPTNYSSSLDTPAATTYEPLELRRGESPVLELSHEDSSEPRQPDVATLTEETPPTMVATVPDTLSEPSVIKNEVEPEADMTPSNIEETAPNDLPEVTQQELPMTDLGVQLGQSSEAPSYTVEPEFVPEAYSTSPALSPVISTSIPKSSIEEDIVPGFSLEQPVGYGVQQEIPNSNPAYENIPLQESEIQSDTGISIEAISPSNKDIPPEPASIPLPEVEEAWDYSPVEPAQSPVQLREDIEQPISEQIPEYTFSETEPKPTSRRSSLARAQLSPVLEAAGLKEPENMPLSENYPNLVSEEPTIIERSEQNDFSPEELVPEYTFPAKTEQEPISRRTSLDGPQLSPIMEASEEPELESLSLSESVSSPVPEHSMTELPGVDLEMSTGDFSPEDILPDYNFPVEAERESISRRASEDRVQLSPILEDTEEPESLPLPDDIPVSLQSLSTGPSAAEALEAEAELPNNDQLAEYTLPEEIEVESIARQFSVEGSQFPQLSMNNQTPVSVVNLVSYEDTVTPLPSDLTESAERYTEEANEIPFFPAPAEVPEISVESPFEPATEVQQVEEEEEQATSQPIYDTLPPVEIESFMPNTEVEFNKDVETPESKIENNTEIEKEEEETQKKESQDEEKEHAEIQDIQFNEARETMAPSSYSDAGEEEKFNEDKIPEPYAGGATFEPAALVEAGGGGVGAWEQGVQLEMPTDTEESNIEAEPIPEKAAEESTQEPILEPTPEQYGASIVESSSPTGEQPGNQPDFHASSGDPTTLPDTQTQVDQEINTEPESQHDALVGDESEQEGVVLELPVVAKQAPAGEKVVLDKEEGKSENAAQENDEEKAQTQHDSTTEFLTLEQAERFWGQEELSTPTVWPTPIPEVESEAEETAIPESEPQYQNEESQAHNQGEEEEERMEPLTSTEEEPVTEKQVDEHKDIQETRSEHQERAQTRPESPKLENEVDWSKLPSSDTALPGANTEPLEREEPRSEFQQDIEYHHFREKPLDQLELSPVAPASPTTKQEVVEQEALPPSPEFESLPETGNIEASAIREVTEVEVKQDGSREQHPDQPGPSVDLTISPIPHELDDFVESRSPVLSPPQNKFEAVKAMAVEPELGETSNTINEPIESSQDNHIEENVDILPSLSEETSPFVGDRSFTTRESYLPFTTPDFPEILQSAIDVEQEDGKKDNRDISATSPQLEEPGHQSRPPTPQNKLPTVDSSRPASPSTEYEDILKRNEETRQIPTLPEIPAYTELELSQKQVSIEEPQKEHAITQAPVVESDTLEYPAPLSSQFVAHMTPGSEEQNSENNKEVSPAINQDQEEIHQLAPPPKGPEAPYQVPKGLTEHVPAPAVTKPLHSRDVPRIPINEEISTQITEAIPLPQGTTVEKSALAEENKSPEYELVPMQTGLSVSGYESVPMQPTLSEGSKRKSKKARQREKKRRSLQGIDISTASAAEAEIMQTPSVAEYPSPSSVVEPIVQNGSNPSPTTKHEDQVTENNAEVKLDRGDEGDKHIQAPESMSKDFTQGYRSLDMGFSEAQKPLSDESTKIENPDRELPVPLRSPSPVIQPEVTGSDLLKEEIKEGTEAPLDRPLPTHQTTPASPSLGTVVADLEGLPGLPPSQPPSRPGTPGIVVDPPSESTPPRFSESRSARKVDVGHLRLPPNIPRDEGLPQLSRDGVVDNEYTGGVSLQLGSETLSEPPSLTTSNDTNISHTFDDPEDEDPSLSSFGDGVIQTVPVAQVGLRSPIFPGGSRPQDFLGTLNPSSQRFFSQQGDIDDPGHDPLSPEGKNQRASTPPIEGDPRAEDGEEGEEGIEHGGDHGSHDTTVITAIENEAAQSDNKKNFPIQVPLQIPVISEEAAPVSKEKTTNTHYTVNAEDPPSQTTINKSTPTTELPLLPPGLSKNLPIEAFESTLSLEQTPPLTHTKLTESFPTSPGVPPRLPFIAGTPVPSVFLENLSQLHTEPSITTQSQTENQGCLGENTNIPPSEPSITPPPLTHSSSFESAIEFWKRQISIPTTTDLIPSPELSPYATHSESGVPLPVSTFQKSPTRPPLVGQASKPLDRETKDSSTTTAGSSVETATASHFELEAENKGPFSGQDPEPPISDPSYQVSIRKVSGENKPRKNIIEINLQKPGSFTFQEPGRLSRRESLKTQDSCDSLRTVITKDDRAPSPAISETRDRDLTLSKDLPEIPENWVSEDVAPETETSAISKGETNKTYKSIFGKQSKSASDPFVGKQDTPTNNQQAFQLSQKILDSSYPSPEAAKEPDNLGSPIRFTKPNLPNITERKPEEAVKQNPPQTASTNERSFISADDLLARLPLQTARKLTPIPGHSSVPQKVQVPSDKKMDILKRGERRRPAPPSLRRAGSQLESPNTSSEHVIFGGGYQTQDSQGKTLRKADLYEAWGDKAGEPKSPTRPPSIRRRQSIQIVDLENRLEGLATENTSLIHEKANIEKTLSESIQRHKNDTAIFTQELENGKVLLIEKDSEITELKKKLEYYRQEVASLTATNTSLSASYKFSYGALTGKYARKREELANLSKEHSELQASFSEVQATMENVIRNQLREKDSELERLRDELAKAREEVRKLQNQVTTRQDNKYLDTKDLHHFSSSCQQLYGSLKIWCNQFSSFSTGKKCVHVHRLKDEAVRDRVEDVMLDDRGVRRMLKDEKRRSEVFMAITMRMIWEHVFTRYLFGLEVDERQKLLSLEKTLAEVGGHEAVHQWRATTLTLLSTRPAIETKRATDTEEIVHTILNLLNFLLPPPPQYNSLALESLRNLVQYAVQLAVEMRTQRAEYVMKRPPRPEYDDNGEVTNSVPFIASSMQNRGVDPASDRELESEGAMVKLVLFPQVIRRGNEYGENYDVEVTVLPMQVLVNRPHLRSESRASNKSVGSAWRDQQQQGGVSRLTPITDHSPGETPRTTPEKAKITTPGVLPMIPEQTIRLVPEDASARAYPSPSAEKRRRLDDQ